MCRLLISECGRVRPFSLAYERLAPYIKIARFKRLSHSHIIGGLTSIIFEVHTANYSALIRFLEPAHVKSVQLCEILLYNCSVEFICCYYLLTWTHRFARVSCNYCCFAVSYLSLKYGRDRLACGTRCCRCERKALRSFRLWSH